MNDEHLKAIQEDVDAMNKAIGEPDGAVEGTEAPGTEAPGTESPGTDAPGTESPSTEAPATEAPTTDAPEEESDGDKELREELERLRGQVEELSGPKTSAPKTSAPTTEAPIEEHDFIGDADLDDLTRDPKEFNKLLNKVYAQGVTNARKLSSESASSLPGVIESTVQTQQIMKTAVDEFYKSNKDLEPFKKVVGIVYGEKAQELSGKDLIEILNETAIETRRRLELKAPKVESKPKVKTQLPRKKGSHIRTTSDEPKGVESEIDQMNEALLT